MEDFKVRLLDEAQALFGKISDLETFISTNDKYKNLAFKHRFCMCMQLVFMRGYYFWLGNRISWHCTQEDLDAYTNKVDTPAAVEVVEDVKEKKAKTKKKTKKN